MSPRVSIIAMSPSPWRGQWVNRQHLLSRLGKTRGVVYSTGSWFPWDIGTEEWQAASWRGRIDRLDNVLVDEPPKWMLRWPKIAPWDRLMLRAHTNRWREALRSDSGPLVAYIFHPAFRPYVAWMHARYLIYHPYDLFDHQPGWSDALARAERDLLSAADLVIAPSQALAHELEARANRDVRVLLNAADVSRFVEATRPNAAEPSDLASISRPRIGYIGSLHPQIDYALLRDLAVKRPSYHWVLVGPTQREQDLRRDPDYVACLTLPNVHRLGPKTNLEVPAYTVNMDVNVMIYRASETSWTKVAYPLKLHEYLASGRPVVSVQLPTLSSLQHVIRFAAGTDDWLDALDEAVARGGRGSPQLRQMAASGHDWASRVATLDLWLDELASGGLTKNR